MLKLRSVVGVVLAALAASVLVAAPGFAAPAVASLTCAAPSGANRDVSLDLAVSGLATDATTPVQVTIMVGSTLALTSTFNATSQWHYVASNAIPSGLRSGSVNVSVTVGSQVDSCTVSWSAFAVSAWSLPKGLAAGKTGVVTTSISSAVSLVDYYAELQYETSTGWHDVDSSWFDSAGTASFTMSATRWKSVRLVIVQEGELTSDFEWASTARIFDVKVATPTVASKPTKVVQTHAGTVVVNFGAYATTGTATLQRKSAAGTWAAVKKATLAHGTATLSWTPTATYTYRVAVTPTGGTTKYTPTFAVKYVPLLTVSAPASAKKNETVHFTLTQYLAPKFTANLQRWNGSAWITVKTFGVGKTVQTVSAKVPGTSKWRISAAGYTSKTITVTVK